MKQKDKRKYSMIQTNKASTNIDFIKQLLISHPVEKKTINNVKITKYKSSKCSIFEKEHIKNILYANYQKKFILNTKFKTSLCNSCKNVWIIFFSDIANTYTKLINLENEKIYVGITKNENMTERFMLQHLYCDEKLQFEIYLFAYYLSLKI